MKKEVKIGIYAVVIIAAAWIGIRFLSGVDVFGQNETYYAYYDDAAGLQNASAVMIRGVKVGQVMQVSVAPEDPSKVKVTMSVSRDYKLPSDSQAKIFSAGLMGGKAIEIILGSSSEVLAPGSDIQSKAEKDMLDMAASELGDLKVKVVELIDNLNKTVTGLNAVVDGNSTTITAAVSNLNAILADLRRSNIVANVNEFTGTLNQNGERIDSTAPISDGAEIVIGENTFVVSELSPEPARVIFSPIIRVSIFEHRKKVLFSTVVTVFASFTYLRLIHSLNAESAIFSTFSGMEISLRFAQNANGPLGFDSPPLIVNTAFPMSATILSSNSTTRTGARWQR